MGFLPPIVIDHCMVGFAWIAFAALDGLLFERLRISMLSVQGWKNGSDYNTSSISEQIYSWITLLVISMVFQLSFMIWRFCFGFRKELNNWVVGLNVQLWNWKMVAVVLSEWFITKIHRSWKTHLLVWSPESSRFVSTLFFFFYGAQGFRH